MRLAIICLLLATSPAGAFTLATSVSESCHERLTEAAILRFATTLAEQIEAGLPIVVPNDRVIRRMMDTLPVAFDVITDDRIRFAAVSVITGVRAPDTEGHSTFDLVALRELHADPAPAGQYAHALRGPADDGVRGDLIAIEGAKAQLRRELKEAQRAAMGEVLESHELYLDHYGGLVVKVSAPAYYIGRAIHVLQDAHAHMLRDADLTYVLHVLNYVDAVNGTRKTHRDGMAHSDAMDDCNRKDATLIAEVTTDRSLALMNAAIEFIQGDEAAVERGLAPCPDSATDPMTCGWIEPVPQCAAAIKSGNAAQIEATCCVASNQFCDTPWLSIAELEPAGPYLGCNARPGSGGPAGWALAVLGLALLGRRRGAWLVLVCAPGVGHADGFIATEGHFAVFSDRPSAALLDPAFGYGVRGGYAFEQLRIVGQIERNHWVRTEFGFGTDPGALNFGIGAEYLVFNGFIRMSALFGASILWFDTLLNTKGTWGPYSEARPAGLRWQVSDALVITFDPLMVAVVFPVVEEPRIRKVQARTTAGLEWRW